MYILVKIRTKFVPKVQLTIGAIGKGNGLILSISLVSMSHDVKGRHKAPMS